MCLIIYPSHFAKHSRSTFLSSLDSIYLTPCWLSYGPIYEARHYALIALNFCCSCHLTCPCEMCLNMSINSNYLLWAVLALVRCITKEVLITNMAIERSLLSQFVLATTHIAHQNGQINKLIYSQFSFAMFSQIFLHCSFE